MSSLSIVLPCYNEEDSIATVVGFLVGAKEGLIKSLELDDIEVIVVNDGSSDESLSKLNLFGDLIRVETLERQSGYGVALKKGFEVAKGEYLAFYDLDNTCHPNDLVQMFSALRSQKLDMVCGNRLGRTSHMPIIRRIGNQFYVLLARLFLDRRVGDCCSGFRVFRKKWVSGFIQNLPDQLNFSMAMTIYLIRLSGRYGEVPIQYFDRLGQSKLNAFKDGIRFLGTFLVYRYFKRFEKTEPFEVNVF